MIGAITKNHNISTSLRFCRHFFSSDFQNVLFKQSLQDFTNSGLQSNAGKTSSFNIDGVLSQLLSEDLNSKAYTKLFNSRKTSPDAYNLANTAVLISHLETNDPYNIFDVISKRYLNAIYLENYVGCYLMDYFLKNDDGLAATLIGLQLVLQDETDNVVVKALATQAFYSFLQDAAKNSGVLYNTNTKTEEKKTRVKYLTNSSDSGIYQRVGNAILKLSTTSSNEINVNMKAIACLLCNKSEDFLQIIECPSNTFHKDVIDLCMSLYDVCGMKNEPALLAMQNLQNENKLSEVLFKDIITSHTVETIKTEEPAIIEKQKMMYDRWAKNAQTLSNELSQITTEPGHKDLNSYMEEIDKTKNKLWYFEMEEKLQLQIHNKKTQYPKRWFGKKKIPKFMEDSYVPPQVTKNY